MIKLFQLLMFSIFLSTNMFAHAQDSTNDLVENSNKDAITYPYSNASRYKVETAAKSGDKDAQYEWGVRLFWNNLDGNIPEKDWNIEEGNIGKRVKLAMPWYLKAAKQNHAESYNNLAIMVTQFAGDSPNYDLGREYWEKGAKLGSTMAKVNYGNNFIDDKKYAEQALKYLLEGEKELGEDSLDMPFLNMSLFRVFTFGIAGEKYDPNTAIQYGVKCAYAATPNAYCQFLVGRYLQNGWAGHKDVDEAAKLYKAAAEADVAQAQWNLGMAYLAGRGVEVDEKLAYQWVKRAAENNYLDGMISFAVMNALGEGTKVNPEVAFFWYEKAAKRGSHHALRGVGIMLHNGDGIEQDEAHGVAALLIAAKEDELAVKILRSFRVDYDVNFDKVMEEYAKPIADIREKYGF